MSESGTPARTARDPLAGRLPITIITGFLGSGKSTLLGRLLRHPQMNRAAVIVNEFGEVGIDHALLSSSTESMTLLPNGCLCCTVRTDLQETLREMFAKRRSGEVIDFDRVFIETTGLADPAPIIHSLVTDGMLAAQYRLDGVVTLVDGVNGATSLDRMAEATKQVATADRLLITKGDLAGAEGLRALRARLAELNPHAVISEVLHGEIDPSELSALGIGRVQESADRVARWLGRADQGPGIGGGDYLGERMRAAGGTHQSGVLTYTLWFDEPFTWASFTTIVQVLTSLRGPDLLRVKGLINIAGEPGPVVVQGVQHLFHEPVTLAAWPDEDRRSRIVFITKGVPRGQVEALFTAIGDLAEAPRSC